MIKHYDCYSFKAHTFFHFYFLKWPNYSSVINSMTYSHQQLQVHNFYLWNPIVGGMKYYFPLKLIDTWSVSKRWKVLLLSWNLFATSIEVLVERLCFRIGSPSSCWLVLHYDGDVTELYFETMFDVCSKRRLFEMTFVLNNVCSKRRLCETTIFRNDVCSKQCLL